MSKTWRSQKVYNEENKVFLKHSSVAELWWEAFIRVDKMSFQSSTSREHQLEPFNYSLSIPSKINLEKYNKTEAILALFGEGTKRDLKKKDNLATIYHELFHVFQTNSTRKTLDYFYLVDDVQRKRTELLEYLGYANFFTWAESTNSDFGKTIFHCVQNYEKLCNKKDMIPILNKKYTQLNKKVSIKKKLDNETKNSEDYLLSSIETSRKKQEEHIKQIDIMQYSDLSRRPIEELIEFFKLQKDTNLHLFHLIEGSAQIFGWCCAGYNIDEKFALRKKDLERENLSQSDTYEKAYELFKENGGKTPLLFILVSLFSLSSSKSIDIFIWSLKKVKTWEKDLEVLYKGKKTTTDIFNSITVKLIEQIENSIRGNFYNANSNSVHDKEDENSLFLKSINRIRGVVPKSNKLEFLSDLVCDEDVVLTLIESFESHVEEFQDDLRKNEVMRDFEQFLYQDYDFELKCCKEHQEDIYRCDTEWKECMNIDAFRNILLNEFKIQMPNKLKKCKGLV